MINSLDKLSELIESGGNSGAAGAVDEISLHSNNSTTATAAGGHSRQETVAVHQKGTVTYTAAAQQTKPATPSSTQTQQINTPRQLTIKEQPQEKELNDYILVYNKPIKDVERKWL